MKIPFVSLGEPNSFSLTSAAPLVYSQPGTPRSCQALNNAPIHGHLRRSTRSPQFSSSNSLRQRPGGTVAVATAPRVFSLRIPRRSGEQGQLVDAGVPSRPQRETLSNRFRNIAIEGGFTRADQQIRGQPQKRTSLWMSRTPRRIALQRPHKESPASVPKGEFVDFANDLPPDGVAGTASLLARGFLRY